MQGAVVCQLCPRCVEKLASPPLESVFLKELYDCINNLNGSVSSFLKRIIFIYLFIFAGSLLLCTGLTLAWRAGTTLSCGAQCSHYWCLMIQSTGCQSTQASVGGCMGSVVAVPGL